jgi:predicted RNase H-like nuclease
LSGSIPSAKALLSTASRLANAAPIDLISIDLPLAHHAITGRRASDNAVSRAFGAYQCGTHSPSHLRPGCLSDRLRCEFEAAGYSLQTTVVAPPALIEVYPHPALVRLAKASVRLPYKLSKARRYWPTSTPLERRENLLKQWAAIVALLQEKIGGVSDLLRPPQAADSVAQLKAYEDMLDAVVCTWVGICALEGRARPYGDASSAIWLPD